MSAIVPSILPYRAILSMSRTVRQTVSFPDQPPSIPASPCRRLCSSSAALTPNRIAGKEGRPILLLEASRRSSAIDLSSDPPG